MQDKHKQYSLRTIIFQTRWSEENRLELDKMERWWNNLQWNVHVEL